MVPRLVKDLRGGIEISMIYKLVALDIDNTLFDWVGYYTRSFGCLIDAVAQETGLNHETLYQESKDVFTERGSIEYPFLIQSLPSVCRFYGKDVDALLNGAVVKGRDAFLEAAEKFLVPYDGVVETLGFIKKSQPGLPLVALTDAPRYVAMWKLNKLGILHLMDAVYGLADPILPVSASKDRIVVDPKILLKHHLKENFGFSGKIRILPDEYEKPGTRGLKTVLMDYNESESIESSQVLWVGDNLRKDVGLGKSLGVRTAWAKFGTEFDRSYLKDLMKFSPEINVRKNVSLDPRDSKTPKPDIVLEAFSDLKALITK